jgi:hypothetical protein
MFTVLSNTRNANLYMITALAILIVVLLTFAFIPSISVKEPAAISENPARLSEALTAYHLGEKAVYTNAVDPNSAFSAYIVGEKAIYANPVASSEALSVQHLGEKAVYSHAGKLDDVLMTYHLGEKTMAGSLEAAMWEYLQGEKGLR